MHGQRVVRLVRALMLVALGVQGLTSPLAKYALARAMPDCVDASPVTAWVGTETHMLLASTECPHGSYSPTRSYFAVVQSAFACSLTALVVGLAALVLALGLGIQTRRMLGSVRGWFARRFTMPVGCLPSILSPRRQPVPVPASARPLRAASRPQLRRGPPACSC